MRTVFDYLQAVQKVINTIPDETEKIINNNAEKIIDLNRIDQLYNKGIDSEGKSLFPEYSSSTILKKSKDNLPFGHVTLFQQGNFYNDFFIQKDIDRWKIFIYSYDEKTNILTDRYGHNIFGLTLENQRELNYQIIKPELDAYIKKYL